MSITLEEIIRIKESRGYSVAKLSEYSGVPVGTLQKLLQGGSTRPREATLAALEKVLYGEESVYPGKSYLYQSESRQPDVLMQSPPCYVNSPACSSQKKNGEYTLEDYNALPEDRRVELIDGVFYDMTAPVPLHQQIAGVIYARILNYIEDNGGDCLPFIAPTDVQLDCDNKTMLQPDVFILCDLQKLKKSGIYGAPDFVLEVLSKSTRKKDMTIKLTKYLDAGVQEYWVIDPDQKILLVYLAEKEGLPHMYPLHGQAPVSLYEGKLQIDLDHIDQMIDRYHKLVGI